MTKSIYTINLLNSLLPKNVNVDISRFPSKDLNEFVPEGAKLPLRCDLHDELISHTGELAKGFTSYQIKRFSTIEYKTQTPCLICDPNSTNKLHPHKIRAYVESQNRLKTHGCIYELMMTNEELYASIDEARNKKSNAEKTKIVIRIKADTRQPGVKNFHPVEVIWKNFRKGVSYSKHDKREKSWVHRFVILIAQAWKLDFQTEVIFEGLNSDSGTPLRIDIGFKEQCEVLEIDGIQHAGCEYVRVSKGAIKEQAYELSQRADSIKNTFFKQHPFVLNRLEAYKPASSGKFKKLSPFESYSIAENWLKEFWKRHFYDPPPEGLERTKIINLIHRSNKDVHAACSERILKWTCGFFKLNSVKKVPDSSKLHVEISCHEGHTMITSEETIRNWNTNQLVQTKEDMGKYCWGCIWHKRLEKLKENLTKYNKNSENVSKILGLSDLEGRLKRPFSVKTIKKELITLMNISDSTQIEIGRALQYSNLRQVLDKNTSQKFIK